MHQPNPQKRPHPRLTPHRPFSAHPHLITRPHPHPRLTPHRPFSAHPHLITIPFIETTRNHTHRREHTQTTPSPSSSSFVFIFLLTVLFFSSIDFKPASPIKASLKPSSPTPFYWDNTQLHQTTPPQPTQITTHTHTHTHTSSPNPQKTTPSPSSSSSPSSFSAHHLTILLRHQQSRPQKRPHTNHALTSIFVFIFLLAVLFFSCKKNKKTKKQKNLSRTLQRPSAPPLYTG